MTTANMNLVLPTEGGSADIWDTILDTAFGLIDAHDHTTGKGVLIPSAALKINADVAWAFGGTSYAITALKAVDFTPVAASSVASLAGAFFVSSADNELYFRSIAGTNIKLTNAGTVNVSLVGGIGGDYASISALFSYDDASHSYFAQQETIAAVRKWAGLRVGAVDIYDSPAATVNRVRLASPSALAASYAITFPAAVPGAAAAVQVSTAGVLTFSNTFTQNLTSTDFRYTSIQTLIIPAMMADTSDRATIIIGGGAPGTISSWRIQTSVNYLIYPIPVRAGDTIKAWRLYVDNASAAGTITGRLYKSSISGGVISDTALGTASTSSAAGVGVFALGNTGLTVLVDNAGGHEQFYVAFTGGGTTGDYAYHLEVDVVRS